MGVQEETRASIARRRLEELTAAYDAQRPRHAAGERPSEWNAPRSHAAASAWRLSPVHLRAAVGVAVAAGILMTWWALSGRPRTTEPVPVNLTSQTADTDGDGAGAPRAASSRRVVIDVTGKVRHPGIVTLKAGSRVHDAIEKAGGVVEGVDTSGLNLARILIDGEQIVVGGPAGTAAAQGPAAPAAGAKVSLSSATLEQLDTLPGIGPVTAQAIIDFRTERGGFRSVDDLLEIQGIGDKTLADLRDEVTP